MINFKQLNTLLLVALILITSAVIYKWTKKSSHQKPEIAKARQSALEKNKKTTEQIQNLYQTKQVFSEQIDQQYEQVKFDRLIVAMRGHHSRDLQRVVSEGLDFSLLPDDAKDKLQQVAREEDFQSLIAPLFENK